MKTILLRDTAIACLLLFQFSNITFCQSPYLGIWEGVFMNDFKTVIELISDENDNYSGKIKMFSGPDLIQDDQISNIIINQNLLTFRINAKDTDFKGEFNTEVSEITGVFIFPDTSEHPLKLSKNENKELSEENSKPPNQYLKNKKYPADELKEDFNFLLNKLKEYHPQLFLYTSKEAFKTCADSILKSLNHDFSIIGFFNLIAPLVEKVKCSHTGIRLPEDYRNGIYSNEHFLPLKLLFTAEKVFCVKNYDNSNSSIITGVEILSINSIPVQSIKESLYQFFPSEGNNLTSKNYQLNKNFNFCFNLIDNSEYFEIEFVKEDVKLRTFVNACNFSVFEEKNEAVQNEMPITFIIDKKNKVGILSVKSFMIHDVNKYIQKMDGIFQSLQNEKIQKLVIDLRGNSGGHPIFAAQLFSYLTNEDFVYFKRNNDVEEFEPLYNTMSPSKLNFNREIYVLVDGGCLSTTGHLISLLKYHTNAVFAGEEPGSTYRCNDFSLKETLPHTKIEVNIPRTTFETAISDSAKSIPFSVDIEINNSIDEQVINSESYMEYIKNLILNP